MDEKSRQDGDSKTIVPLTMLSMVADDVKQQLAGGIMSLIVSYINGNVSIDAVLGACSVCYQHIYCIVLCAFIFEILSYLKAF